MFRPCPNIISLTVRLVSVISRKGVPGVIMGCTGGGDVEVSLIPRPRTGVMGKGGGVGVGVVGDLVCIDCCPW